ncbi:MAG: acyl-CoA synthetase FdrA [Actinomycetota bacterium]
MTDLLVIRRATYYDSVTLMLASSDAEAIEGVSFAAAVTATPVNVALLEAQGFDLSSESPGPNDLVVAVRAGDDRAAEEAERAVQARLTPAAKAASSTPGHIAPRSWRSAVRANSNLSLAFVSVPGRYATAEVAGALEAGLDVFCFSDGLSLEAEAALKQRALERGLLLMGPDCGTAIIDGVGLGFANAVGRGPVGIVGASGTGIQEVSCLLDSAGVGISHAIGVGGRDLSRAVGGAMSMRALELLDADDATEVIVVISKPPDRDTAARVVEAAGRTNKRIVVGFLGESNFVDAASNVTIVDSLEAASTQAAQQTGRELDLSPPPPQRLTPGFIRGLFCGGSLCYEAMLVVSAAGWPVASNVPLVPHWRLEDVETSVGDTFIDFGADEFTQGRAHPMIDPTLRTERLEREAKDAEVGAIVLDVVLGYGAHRDPATELAPVVEAALASRSDDLAIVVALCGATADPQDLEAQATRLGDAGALVTRGSAQATRAAVAATGDTDDGNDG